MKQILIAVAVIAAIGVGLFLYTASDTTTTTRRVSAGERRREAAEMTKIIRESSATSAFTTAGMEDEVLVYGHGNGQDCTVGDLAWLLSMKNLRARIEEDGFVKFRCGNFAAEATPPWDAAAQRLKEEALAKLPAGPSRELLRKALERGGSR